VTAVELQKFLVQLYPEFGTWWESSDFRDGREFTPHGVCLEFAHFYSDSGVSLDPRRAWDLFNKVEELVAADPKDNNATANALCTCFLQGIAGTPAGISSAPFMGKATREYFDRWHVEP
jgi:hypothetical protein